MKQSVIDQDLIVKIKSHFNITNKEKAWLEAMWHHMKTNFSYPEYRQIRAATITKTGTAYNPRSINPLLVINTHELQIRFLGLLIISPNDEIFNIGLKLILEVRQQLMDDSDKADFEIEELATKLKIDANKLMLTFKVFSSFFSMYNQSGSNSIKNNQIKVDSFSVSSDSSIDFYLSFTDLNQYIWDKFQSCTQDNSALLPIPKQAYFPKSTSFIDYNRLKELEQINSSKFDLAKLIQLVKEIEWCFANGNYYATALLQRAFIDHIPPLFECTKFSEVVDNYKSVGNSRSFKKSMEHLNNSLRAIGDSSIHSQIRQKEVLPNARQVDFSSDFDVLLAEIVRLLK